MISRRRKPSTKENRAFRTEQNAVRNLLAGIMELIQELENSFEERVHRLQAAADDSIMSLKNESKRLLVTLPKRVRSMPLEQFQREYPNDFQSGALEQIRERYAAMAEAVKQAPMTKRGVEPATVLRTVRSKMIQKGSSHRSQQTALLNANSSGNLACSAPQFNGIPLQTPMPFSGAPVALPVTMLAQKRPGARTKAVPAPEAAVITTEDGKQWALGVGGISGIPETHRKEVSELLAAQYEFLAAALGKTVSAARGTRKRRIR